MKLFFRVCVSLSLCAFVCLESTGCNKSMQEDNMAELLQEVNIMPCYATDDKLTEEEQLSLVEETLYPNAMTILNWIYLGTLDVDANVTSAHYTTDVLHYSLVNSVPNQAALESVCEVVFFIGF